MGWIGSTVGLASSSKTAPRILIFLIATDANYSFQMKNIEIWAPSFFQHNNLSIVTLRCSSGKIHNVKNLKRNLKTMLYTLIWTRIP
jgi:hypothetical protein